MKNMLKKMTNLITVKRGMKYGCYIDYPNVGRIYDEQVWDLVKDHSRLIDRISTKKMTEMSLLGQNILMGIYKGVKPEDSDWMFYGKRALYKQPKKWD